MGKPESMTFAAFSEVNRRRCESYNGFGESLQEESKYTLEHWAMSIVAEAGEICDAILGWRGLKRSRAGKTKDDIAKELADVVTYCDLALQKLGYDTGEMLARKFNEVNERCGFGERFALASRTAHPAVPPNHPEIPDSSRDVAVPGEPRDDNALNVCAEHCTQCENPSGAPVGNCHCACHRR